MTREEVMISLGIDNSQIGPGMRSATAKVEAGGAQMITSIKKVVSTVNLLKSALMFGGVLSAPTFLSGLVDQYNNALGWIAKTEEALRKFAGLGQSMEEREKRSEQRRMKLHENVKAMQAAELAHATTMLKINNELAAVLGRNQKSKLEKEFSRANGDARLKMLEKEQEAIQKNLDANKEEVRLLDIKDESFGKTKERDEFRLQLETSIAILSGKIFDNENKISEEKERQLSVERQIALLAQAKADRGKMTQEEIRNSKNPELQGDRDKLAKADSLRAQGEQLRLKGDSAGAEKLFKQADQALVGRDRSEMTPMDKINESWRDHLKVRGMNSSAQFYQDRLDARGFGEIKSLKTSDGGKGSDPSINELQAIKNELKAINKRIGNVGTN